MYMLVKVSDSSLSFRSLLSKSQSCFQPKIASCICCDQYFEGCQPHDNGATCVKAVEAIVLSPEVDM